MRRRSPSRSQFVVLLAAVSIAAVSRSFAQTADITKPPPILEVTAGAKATERSRPPAVDGRTWIAANVRHPLSGDDIAVPTRAFSLTFRDWGDHGGDFERCQLFFQRGQGAPVRIHEGFTGWVFVTPDSRYIITEPLYVLDVREWRQYALFEALGIPNYTHIEAVSRDGKRLFLSRRDCAMDCRDQRVEYYALTLP
jgi:hypothetical protein